jgi:hypothetical protein
MKKKIETPSINSGKYGQFEISDVFMGSMADVVVDIMGMVLITKAEHDYGANLFRYWGYCSLFEISKPGHPIKKYMFGAERVNGKNKISVEKIKD